MEVNLLYLLFRKYQDVCSTDHPFSLITHDLTKDPFYIVSLMGLPKPFPYNHGKATILIGIFCIGEVKVPAINPFTLPEDQGDFVTVSNPDDLPGR